MPTHATLDETGKVEIEQLPLDGLTQITVGGTAPPTPNTGDLWVDTS